MSKWSEKILGELFTLEYGAGLPEAIRKKGNFIVYGSNGPVGWHDKFMCSGPGIIVGRKGSVGEICWAESDFWPIDTTFYARPKTEIDLRWLYWLLLFMNLSKLNSSTGVPGLNRNDVYTLSTKLPLKEEQRAIAAILDQVEETIRRTEALVEKLRCVKAGLFHDLLICGLDENGQLRDPIRHPEQFKDSPLGRVPKEWDVRSLENTATLQRGKDLPIQDRRSGRVPVYGSNGIDGYHDSAFMGGPGVITGRSGTIGYVYYEGGPYWPLNTTLYVKNFYGNYPPFVARLLTFMRLERFAAATGVPSLNRNFVHPVLVSVPPRREQEKIEEILEFHDQHGGNEANYLQKLKLLKQGVMQDLLTGHVRVPKSLIERHQGAAIEG